MTHETLAPYPDAGVDVADSEPMLHTSATAWPDGTPAAVFGQNYWSLPVGTWAMLAELDAYGIPWHVLDDLATPLIYVPESDSAAFALLTSGGWSRTDNTLLDWIAKPLVNGYEAGPVSLAALAATGGITMTYDEHPIPGHVQVAEDRARMRRTTFVHPTGGEVVRREPLHVQPMPSIQPMERREVRQKEIITGTSADRAHAFVIRTRMISFMAAGATALIWFLVRYALPMTTGGATAGVLLVGVGAILAALTMFFVVWFAAYVIDVLLSPGGLDLYESRKTQRRIDAQSNAMIEAYRKAHGIEVDL